jgi:hypothetical protein
VAGLSTLQRSSPDTAAGPPRIHTVFRFVEPNGAGIFTLCTYTGQAAGLLPISGGDPQDVGTVI